ncbi:MAG: cytochrome c-type biogenesis protein CcmH [SAR202 cluster bacterium]|nr:cytochrome c-type biogenesis protein CcmH [SAR202 cluster bacterium]
MPPPPGVFDEAEAQSIDRMLMCPICPGESIDQSQVELAKQMRQRVREMLAQGTTRQQVLDFFVERYGPTVLAAPPKSGLNLLAWVLPVALVAAALAGGFLALRAMRRGNPEPVLDPYLAAVDARLSSSNLAEGQGRPDNNG